MGLFLCPVLFGLSCVFSIEYSVESITEFKMLVCSFSGIVACSKMVGRVNCYSALIYSPNVFGNRFLLRTWLVNDNAL